MFTDSLPFDRGEQGTTVWLRRRLSRPVTLSASRPVPIRPTGRPHDGRTSCIPGHLIVSGAVDATTADRFATRLNTETRAGTCALALDLPHVTHLASAGVQVLHQMAATLAVNDEALTLYAPGGSVADSVLTLAGLSHTA